MIQNNRDFGPLRRGQITQMPRKVSKKFTMSRGGANGKPAAMKVEDYFRGI